MLLKNEEKTQDAGMAWLFAMLKGVKKILWIMI